MANNANMALFYKCTGYWWRGLLLTAYELMWIVALVSGVPETQFNSWILWLFFVVVVQLAEVALRQGWQGLFGCVELRRVLPTDAAAQRRNGPQRSEKNVWGCPAQLEAVHPSVISSTAHVNQLLLPRYFQIANVNQQKKKRQGALNVEEFIEFYHLLVVRPELDSLFRKYDPF